MYRYRFGRSSGIVYRDFICSVVQCYKNKLNRNIWVYFIWLSIENLTFSLSLSFFSLSLSLSLSVSISLLNPSTVHLSTLLSTNLCSQKPATGLPMHPSTHQSVKPGYTSIPKPLDDPLTRRPVNQTTWRHTNPGPVNPATRQPFDYWPFVLTALHTMIIS